MSEFVVTNFNPATVTVWLHNDRNTNSTIVGLREGLHIVRSRSFLPRTNKSSVFNTFLQTFYYDAAPPGGAIAIPASDGNTISNASYQVVIRGDSTVSAVEFNIADSNANNDDALTGQNNGNGLTNGVAKFVTATQVTPEPTLSALYPNYPQEFRFTYSAVPTNGSATLTVRLKEAVTAVLPTRFTTLTRTVNTLAPVQTLFISDPPSDGFTLTLATNDVYTLRTCFSQALTTTNIDLFSIFINGEFQTRRATNGTPLYFISPIGCGNGLRQLRYDWSGAPVGSNYLQIVFTNTLVLGGTRWVNVSRPIDYTLDSDGDGMLDWQETIAGTNPFDSNSVLRITSLSDGNQLVVWDSVSNVNYQVLATTNLSQPMVPISPIIPASGASAFFYDTATAQNKYYRIQVVP